MSPATLNAENIVMTATKIAADKKPIKKKNMIKSFLFVCSNSIQLFNRSQIIRGVLPTCYRRVKFRQIWVTKLLRLEITKEERKERWLSQTGILNQKVGKRRY
jgi:hypothetical protein